MDVTQWFRDLGDFEEIQQPREAAERWGVDVREAMSRLHMMIGDFLVIPDGKVETYRVHIDRDAIKMIIPDRKPYRRKITPFRPKKKIEYPHV